MTPVASPSVWGGNVVWVMVFVANLIVPLLFGWQVTQDGGRAGMVAATAVMLLLTLLVVPKWSEMRMTLVVGGIFTAITQAFPLVQIVVGILSLLAVQWLGFEQETGLSFDRTGRVSSRAFDGVDDVGFGVHVRCVPQSGRQKR